jgi:hypothetical protein
VELGERIEADDAREKREWFRTAWLASQIVSYLVGKPVAISDLLPEMFPAKVWTKAEIKKELAELKKILKMED